MRCAPLLAVALVAAGCRVEVGPPQARQTAAAAHGPSGTVMVYTSMYREVIDAVKPTLAEALPGVEVKWLQGGSEKLATRLDAELAAGAPQADLILTSDPLWYERLRREGHLLPYASLPALRLRRDLIHPTGAYLTSRLSTMVIAYNSRLVPEGEAPRTFAGLFDDRWAGKVTCPDPLASGTAFSTLAQLLHHEGPGLLARMKAAKLVASGGNSSAFTRLESGEHHVGFVLLENVLAARANGSPVAYRIPDEGAVPVPGPLAILKAGPNPEAAKAVYDLILSEPVQRAIVAAHMHGVFEDLPPPDDAPDLTHVLDTRYRFTPEFVDATVEEAQAIRQRFAEAMGAP